jgi:hypothetical protein
VYYILNEQGQTVATPDVLTWARWFEQAEAVKQRVVKQDHVGDVLVSTVFLALDHAFGGGLPILWETLVFGGPFDGEMARYVTRGEAEEGHDRMVRRVRGDGAL